MSKVDFYDKSFVGRAEEITDSLDGSSPNSFQTWASRAIAYPLAAASYVFPKSKPVSRSVIQKQFDLRDNLASLRERYSRPRDLSSENKIFSKPFMPSKGKSLAAQKFAKRFPQSQTALAARKKRLKPPPKRKRLRKFGSRGMPKKRFVVPMSKPSRSVATRPPTNYGRSGGIGMAMEFYRGRGPGCLGIHGTFLFGLMSTSSVGEISISTPSGSTVAGQILGQPQNEFYFDEIASNIAINFQRYRLATRLHFRSRSATSVNGSVAMVWVDDPFALQSISITDTFASFIPFHGVASMSGVTETNIYKSWTTPWSHEAKGDEMKYMTAYDYNGIEDITNDPATLRSYTTGAWWITSAGIDGSTNNFGDLWIEYRLELCDIIGIAGTLPSGSLSGVRHRRKPLIKSDVKRVDFDLAIKRLEEKFASLSADADDVVFIPPCPICGQESCICKIYSERKEPAVRVPSRSSSNKSTK